VPALLPTVACLLANALCQFTVPGNTESMDAIAISSRRAEASMLLALGLILMAIGVTMREAGSLWGPVDLRVVGSILMAVGGIVFALAIVHANRVSREEAESRYRECEELGVAEGHCPPQETVPLSPSFGRWRIFGSPRE
jgi:hypothetical protein